MWTVTDSDEQTQPRLDTALYLQTVTVVRNPQTLGQSVYLFNQHSRKTGYKSGGLWGEAARGGAAGICLLRHANLSDITSMLGWNPPGEHDKMPRARQKPRLHFCTGPGLREILLSPRCGKAKSLFSSL